MFRDKSFWYILCNAATVCWYFSNNSIGTLCHGINHFDIFRLELLQFVGTFRVIGLVHSRKIVIHFRTRSCLSQENRWAQYHEFPKKVEGTLCLNHCFDWFFIYGVSRSILLYEQLWLHAKTRSFLLNVFFLFA